MNRLRATSKTMTRPSRLLVLLGMAPFATLSLVAQVDTSYVREGMTVYEMLPISVTAERSVLGRTEVDLSRETVERALERAGLDRVRRGGLLTGDVYFDGFKRGDVEIVVDGERFPNSCPNRMDPAVSRVNPLEIQSLTVDRSTAGLHAGIGGTVSFHRIEPGTRPRVTAFSGFSGGAGPLAEVGLAAEAHAVRLTTRYLHGKPYVDGDGRSFSNLYGYALEHRFALLETSLQVSRGALSLGGSVSRSDDVPFPYLQMDERSNRLWSAFAAYRGLRLYGNHTEHRMDNGLRSDARSMVMESNVDNTTVGLTSEHVEAYYRRWDGWNSMAMTMGMAPAVLQHLLPEIGTLSGTVRYDYDWHGFVLGGRLGVQVVGLGDEDRLSVFEPVVDSPAAHRWFAPFALVGRYSGMLTEDLAAGVEAEFGSRPPVAEELYVALKRPMNKPHWIGNPTLRSAKRLSARGAVSGASWSAEVFGAVVEDYPIPVSRVTESGKVMTYDGVRALLAGVRLTYEEGPVALSGDYNVGQNVTAGTPLAEIAPIRGSLRVLSPRRRGFTAFAALAGAAAQHRIDPALGEESSPAWYRLDAGMDFRTRYLLVQAEISNLLDRTYAEHLSYMRNPFAAGVRVYEPGRIVRVSLTVHVE